jgi:hypothetical protein
MLSELRMGMHDWPDAGPLAGVQGHTGIENTSASPQAAFVFSIPVCPSPREARTGQVDEKPSLHLFFSASSAISARDRF